MKKILSYLLVSFLLIFLNLNILDAQERSEPKHLADGPYLIHLPDGKTRLISTAVDGILKDTSMYKMSEDLQVMSHSGKHHFKVKLHPIERQPWKQEVPEKLLVISDPHGNFDCFFSVLRGNQVINANYEWIYGKNHLMIIGDVFDRGKDVLPIFWLIYKLEKEAEDAGGQVSFLLGNHEAMVLAGDYRYADKMYTELAGQLDMDYRELFAPSTELGAWLNTRNTMQIIGKTLFVHAGLGDAFLKKNLSIPEVNEEMFRALFMTKQERNECSLLTKFLYGNEGPIWYRGMVRNDDKYLPLYEDTLDELLKKYQVDRVVVGHTIFPDIRTFYNTKVITVNVDNKKNFKEVSGRGILIENNKMYVVCDKGIMKQVMIQ